MPFYAGKHVTGICFLLTYKCTARCNYCSFGCSPQETAFLDCETIGNVIDFFVSHMSPKVVIFSGGEPTLCWDVLLAGISRATRQHLVSRIVSNAFWATTSRRAEKAVLALKAAGLKELNVTTGTEHAAFVPVDNVIYAIAASLNHGLTTVLVVESDPGACRIADTVMHSAVSFSGRKPMLSIAPKVWFGPDSGCQSRVGGHDTPKELRCRSVLRTIAVTPDRLLYPCCGLPIRSLPGMSVCTVDELVNAYGVEEFEDRFFTYQNARVFVDQMSKVVLEAGLRYDPSWHHPCQVCDALHRQSDFFAKEFSADDFTYSDVAAKFAMSTMLDNAGFAE